MYVLRYVVGSRIIENTAAFESLRSSTQSGTVSHLQTAESIGTDLNEAPKPHLLDPQLRL